MKVSNVILIFFSKENPPTFNTKRKIPTPLFSGRTIRQGRDVNA
jgi:hypothetical protein